MDETSDEAVDDRWLGMDLSVGPTTAAAPAGPRKFAAALRQLSSRDDVDATLQLMVDLATELVSGCDLADVMLVGPDGATTPVATDPLAVLVDRAQAETGEGPCLHVALDGETIVRVDDLPTDARWPAFARLAVELGVRSVLSYRLYLDDDRTNRIGALNLYGHRPGAFDTSSVGLGEVFAAQCASVLASAVEVEGLRIALASRDLIGQAKGIVMERHLVDAAAAFDLLRQTSQDRNIKLQQVAAYVVAQRRLP